MSQFFTVELSDPRFESDNLRLITVKSPALKKRADISVFVPDVTLSEIKGMVILLHGVYGSHWAWTLKGGVHKTAQRLIIEGKLPPMLLVMPSDGLFGDGSGYVPHQSENYEKWIVEDVVNAVKEQISGRDLPLFITGLSMGGYGALRLGAQYPTLFRAFSGHSSITEFGQLRQFVEDFEELSTSIQAQESVLESLLKNKSILPPFRFDCGSKDPLLEPNRELHEALVQHGIEHHYEEFTGGHEWPYWEKHIVDSLLFFGSLCS
ncbi:alpha/beta hydrolase-fold protein [Runella sp.]|jgi:putative tributyrin esterase|uniref:alpha/beta hydrolase n=1 Tax=Runella sp. TaxID=1960881 RepID=UPI0026221F85|nr:alpha/beta hydrolase-fold protein [Runella sp.]